MNWKQELQATPGCVPIERFEALTPADEDHIANCAHCEAEFALFQSVTDPAPAEGEGAAVRWIAAEVTRRRSGAARSSRAGGLWTRWLEAMRPRVLAGAAVIVLLASALYLGRDAEPPLGTPRDSANVLRSAAIDVLGPTGDVTPAPGSLRWKPIAGAQIYDVQVLEVDRTVLWRSSTRGTELELPASLRAQFVPGKTVLWEVSARGADPAAVIAESGTQRFRVAFGGAARER